jgi:hypothetical protein
METEAKAGGKVRWLLAGLAGLVLFYGSLLGALAARTAAVMPIDAESWFAALGGL